MKLPPMIVRRLVLAPLVFVLSLALVALSPLFFLIAFVIDLVVRGGFRSVRLVAFGAWYLIYELAGLVLMLVLWVRAGFGTRFHTPAIDDAHYRCQRWWLRGINGAAKVCFRLRIQIEDRPAPTPGPILVFSRHAGPGNSLMLVGTIMIGYQRRPRVVMLAKLQWEPLFDIMLNRLPNRFIEHDPNKRDAQVRAIAELAGGLGDQDAYVLFPEGHDFTPRLRLKAIAHLFKRGYQEHAQLAERMQHVLPPKSGGVMAAINAAPDADVVFVAHTVLEDVGSFKSLWSRMPMKGPIFSRYWRIPAAEVPREREELTRWLFEWWARIDQWVEQRLASMDPGAARPTGRTVSA
ncbi:MAG TPA: 1-acyl-sn-glycerol-3-phosphate acyltransferase [Actinomycetota bacterium]|nr:1-acyl-sn-glycerol-3-phosphate acyltransferase [Actinomycetota bacterium]